MKRIFLGAILSLFTMVQSFALEFTVDGINYETKGGTTCEVASYNNVLGNIKLPETVTYNKVTYTVTSIGVAAFEECYDLTSIEIPNSVKSIGSSAFSECI